MAVKGDVPGGPLKHQDLLEQVREPSNSGKSITGPRERVQRPGGGRSPAPLENSREASAAAAE